MFDRMMEDIRCVLDRDPAAHSAIEVMLLYPGFKAIRSHRKAHWFYKKKMFFIARMISQRNVKRTGIEIHPGAEIGRRFFIDHGMGVVIGETTYIGDDVLLYQGVTLGGTGKEHGKRHPTLEDNVIVGAGAKVLGNLIIGKNSRIGAGSVVVDNVPQDSTVVGIPGRVVHQRVLIDGQLMHNRMPDPVKCQLNRLTYEVQEIKERLNLTTGGKTDC